MKLASAKLTHFKRFSDLKVYNIPETARLIVLLGPNGCGKSSFFDALHSSLKVSRFFGFSSESWTYFDRLPSSINEDTKSRSDPNIQERVKLEFHGPGPKSMEDYRKSIYIRTAYRHQPSFKNTAISSPEDILEEIRFQRLIDDDKTVASNYSRMIWRLLQQATTPDLTTNQIMYDTIGDLKASMKRMFVDLNLDALVTPEEKSSFTFSKGDTKHFLYENLSGGEKAAFDLLLDIVVKRKSYSNSLYCIDEPELHLSTRLQGRLLEEIFRLIPKPSQLWIATQSIGMVRKAQELRLDRPGEVVFLDFGFRADGAVRNFDRTEVVEPSMPSRDFWSRHYDVALDDMGKLLAPKRVVLCEGQSVRGGQAFDEACYNRIFFSKYPDTRFVSVGSAEDLDRRMSELVPLIGQIIEGTAIIRFRD